MSGRPAPSAAEAVRKRFDVVIVGAGHSGAQTAIGLRQRGFDGSIALIGDENELPYERPPLSKEYLLGEKAFERMLIRPAAFWAEREVRMLTGMSVVALHAEDRTVLCADGSRIGYGSLVWAAGGRPRRLSCPGHDLAGVHVVRTRSDVDRMNDELAVSARVCVVGGGYIGLETAAVLAKLGKHVTVLEAADRLLARGCGVVLSRFLEAEHRSHGVHVRCSAAVAAIDETNGRASGVRLADGEIIRCDMVIVGIGINPAVAPLIAAGARGGNGVEVDAHCRTSLADVFAVGDCALHANPFADGRPTRLESVQNANDMAGVVSRTLTGAPSTYDAVPWFWSNQYDLRLQTVGLSTGYDQEVVRGDQGARSFSVVYLKNGEVRALDCVNATKDYVGGRALVASRARVPLDRLVDAAVPLKELAAAGTPNRSSEGPSTTRARPVTAHVSHESGRLL